MNKFARLLFQGAETTYLNRWARAIEVLQEAIRRNDCDQAYEEYRAICENINETVREVKCTGYTGFFASREKKKFFAHMDSNREQAYSLLFEACMKRGWPLPSREMEERDASRGGKQTD